MRNGAHPWGSAVSPEVLRALQVLAGGPIRPAEFARRLWPNAEGWSRCSKCGRGSHRGGGMVLAAGGYLGRLRKLGLAEAGSTPGTTRISRAGRAALEASAAGALPLAGAPAELAGLE